MSKFDRTQLASIRTRLLAYWNTTTAHFSSRVGLAFAAAIVLALLSAVVASRAVHSVVESKDRLTVRSVAELGGVEKLRALAYRRTSVSRAFLLTRDRLYIEDARDGEVDFKRLLDGLRASASGPRDTEALDRIEAADKAHAAVLAHAILMRKRQAPATEVARYFDRWVMPRFDRLETAMDAYVRLKEAELVGDRDLSNAAARHAIIGIDLMAATVVLLLIGLAAWLARTLSRLYDEARDAARMREDMLAIVSHDLRNPLSAVLMSSMLIHRLETDPKKRHYAEIIREAAKRMERMIEDLLDLARIRSGKLVIERRAIAPAKLLENSRYLLAPVAAHSKIQLTVECEPDLPDAHCDPERVHQVLSNLVGNAVKFTPPEGRVTLVARRGANAREIRFDVRDTGPGIAPEKIPHLFDRGWQADMSARTGIGLGLFIAKAMVEAHGGSIDVASAPGHGSCFSFSLPVVAAPGTTGTLPEPSTMAGLRTSPSGRTSLAPSTGVQSNNPLSG